MYARPAEAGKAAEPSSSRKRQAVRVSRISAVIAFLIGLPLLAGGIASSGPELDVALSAAFLGTALLAASTMSIILLSHGWTWIFARAARLRRHIKLRRLEEMKDAQWTQTDSAVGYRRFLDAQTDLIVRYSLDGRLRFANRAFLKAFGVTAEKIVGSGYRPTVIKAVPAAGSPASARRTLELLRTRQGNRWIAWDASEVIGETGEIEIQSVGRDITADRDIREKLKAARDRAEASNEEKSRFLAAMSQEIRTPAMGIIGMMARMRDRRLDDEQAKQALIVEETAQALLVFLDDIQDLSDIDAGKVDLTTGVFSLADCIEQAIEFTMVEASAKQVALTCTLAEAVPEWVRGDEMRVRQIVLNLLSQAMKATQSSSVEVRIALDKAKPSFSNAIRISIEVAGSAAHLPAAPSCGPVRPRDPAAPTRSETPTLGMEISKRLAQAMSGSIVASGGRGQGAHITAVLELQRADPPRGAAETSEASPALKHPVTVLVAEDDRINALLACKVIERAGGRATVVEDGRCAIKAIWETLEGKRPAFDLILMDLLMPGLDGLTATKSIKALFEQRKPAAPCCPPIIALTANAFPEDRDRCQAAGMDDYLAKPFDAGDLHDMLVKWTAQGLAQATPAA